MAGVGMLVDLSHMSKKSSLQAIEQVAKPVVFTHSNARAVYDHYRNITDEQVRACAAVGGLVGVSGSRMYIGDHRTLAEGMFRHLDHMVQLVGADHVGLGTDYVANSESLQKYFASRPDEWPNGVQQRLEYLMPEHVWSVVSQMESAGYSADDVRKILGGNYIRVASAVWR
jgi:membrane dipeptidase